MIAPQESAAQALLHLPADVPVVAAEAGPHDAVPLRRRRPGGRRARRPPQHLLELGHRTVWHICRAAGLARGRRTASTAGAPRSRPPGAERAAAAARRLERALGLRARPASWPRARRHRRVRRPTTRWRWACSAPCTSPAARIPEDISVVGFDDIPEAAYFTPPLTTVRQDFDELGPPGAAGAARPDRVPPARGHGETVRRSSSCARYAGPRG